MTFQIKKKKLHQKLNEVKIYINTHFKHIIVKRMINFLIINLHKYLQHKIFNIGFYMEKLDKTLLCTHIKQKNINKGVFCKLPAIQFKN